MREVLLADKACPLDSQPSSASAWEVLSHFATLQTLFWSVPTIYSTRVAAR
jgi:hypothetical protein